MTSRFDVREDGEDNGSRGSACVAPAVTRVQAQDEATGWPGFGTSGLLPKHDNFNFLDPARRRRDGVKPAPQNGQRGGLKEDYYA